MRKLHKLKSNSTFSKMNKKKYMDAQIFIKCIRLIFYMILIFPTQFWNYLLCEINFISSGWQHLNSVWVQSSIQCWTWNFTVYMIVKLFCKHFLTLKKSWTYTLHRKDTRFRSSLSWCSLFCITYIWWIHK